MDPRYTTVATAVKILNLPDLTDEQIKTLCRYFVHDMGPTLIMALHPYIRPVTFTIIDDLERWLEVSLLHLRADKAQLLAKAEDS